MHLVSKSSRLGQVMCFVMFLLLVFYYLDTVTCIPFKRTIEVECPAPRMPSTLDDAPSSTEFARSAAESRNLSMSRMYFAKDPQYSVGGGGDNGVRSVCFFNPEHDPRTATGVDSRECPMAVPSLDSALWAVSSTCQGDFISSEGTLLTVISTTFVFYLIFFLLDARVERRVNRAHDAFHERVGEARRETLDALEANQGRNGEPPAPLFTGLRDLDLVPEPVSPEQLIKVDRAESRVRWATNLFIAWKLFAAAVLMPNIVVLGESIAERLTTQAGIDIMPSYYSNPSWDRKFLCVWLDGTLYPRDMFPGLVSDTDRAITKLHSALHEQGANSTAYLSALEVAGRLGFSAADGLTRVRRCADRFLCSYPRSSLLTVLVVCATVVSMLAAIMLIRSLVVVVKYRRARMWRKPEEKKKKGFIANFVTKEAEASARAVRDIAGRTARPVANAAARFREFVPHTVGAAGAAMWTNSVGDNLVDALGNIRDTSGRLIAKGRRQSVSFAASNASVVSSPSITHRGVPSDVGSVHPHQSLFPGQHNASGGNIHNSGGGNMGSNGGIDTNGDASGSQSRHRRPLVTASTTSLAATSSSNIENQRRPPHVSTVFAGQEQASLGPQRQEVPNLVNDAIVVGSAVKKAIRARNASANANSTTGKQPAEHPSPSPRMGRGSDDSDTSDSDQALARGTPGKKKR